MSHALSNLCLLSIPLWIPGVIGLYLLANRRNELGLMAGLLTLKPILTTPLWVLIISFLQRDGVAAAPIALYSILPGASLTVMTLVIFRPLFFGSRSTLARMLILLDCMRWVNSYLLTRIASLPYGYSEAMGSMACVFALLGLIFPTAYAVVALTTTLATNEG